MSKGASQMAPQIEHETQRAENQAIYVYFITKTGLVVFENSFARSGLGPKNAKLRVEKLEKIHGEGNVFYTCGFPIKGALT